MQFDATGDGQGRFDDRQAQTLARRRFAAYDTKSAIIVGHQRDTARQFDPSPDAAPNEQGWLWSEVLGAYIGTWRGKLYGREQTWLCLYDAEGNLVLLSEEREAIARAQAEQARQRAEAAERRVAELEAELKRLRGG